MITEVVQCLLKSNYCQQQLVGRLVTGAAGRERQRHAVLVYLPRSDLVYLLSEEGDVADLRRGARDTYWGREICYKSCQEPLCRAGSSI